MNHKMFFQVIDAMLLVLFIVLSIHVFQGALSTTYDKVYEEIKQEQQDAQASSNIEEKYGEFYS